VRLTKHEGLGNDFLVLLDRDSSSPVDGELARAVCDRHLGVGADGLLRATPSESEGVDARMELFNADGSVAEISGNGIRCLGQALLLAGWTARSDRVVIATYAGVRTLTVWETFDEGRWAAPAEAGGAVAGAGPATAPATGTVAASRTMVLSVDMGPARIGGDAPDWVGAAGGAVRRALWVDMGNPHLVAEIGDEADVDHDGLVTLGERVNATVPGGANVHLLVAGPPRPVGSAGPSEPPGRADGIAIRTYERGVGPTRACGSGACASAVAAHRWGLVGPSLTVDMPGGRAVVEVDATVTLTGPATAVAAVEYPWP
jgi:diaminopimelate epimerase